MSTPISAARWLCGGALIRPSTKIVRLIGDFNSLCSFTIPTPKPYPLRHSMPVAIVTGARNLPRFAKIGARRDVDLAYYVPKSLFHLGAVIMGDTHAENDNPLTI